MRKPIIKSISKNDTIEIFGHQVNGLNAILDAIEVSTTHAHYTINEDGTKNVWDKPYISFQEPKVRIPGLHILEVYQRFPCFDSYDYAYEDRYFYNFFFSDKPFSSDEINRIAEMDRGGMLEFLSDSMPDWAFPSAYYSDADEKITFAF